MENLLKNVESQLKALRTFDTPSVRKASAKIYRAMKDVSFEEFLKRCETMLKTENWSHKMMAFDWAHRRRREFTKKTFDVFKRWLFDYVKDWSDCDDFCTHALGELFKMYPSFFDRVFACMKSERFPVRRAEAVVSFCPYAGVSTTNNRCFPLRRL